MASSSVGSIQCVQYCNYISSSTHVKPFAEPKDCFVSIKNNAVITDIHMYVMCAYMSIYFN